MSAPCSILRSESEGESKEKTRKDPRDYKLLIIVHPNQAVLDGGFNPVEKYLSNWTSPQVVKIPLSVTCSIMRNYAHK